MCVWGGGGGVLRIAGKLSQDTLAVHVYTVMSLYLVKRISEVLGKGGATVSFSGIQIHIESDLPLALLVPDPDPDPYLHVAAMESTILYYRLDIKLYI